MTISSNSPPVTEQPAPRLEALFPYKGLEVAKAKHQLFESTNGVNTIPMVYENALVGIEVEVENIRKEVPITHYWSGKEDGSLRNNGAEYTSIPLRTHQVETALNHLMTKLNMWNTPEFSPRTSIHIHLYVRDMTWDQVKTLLIFYAIFERHFFMLAGGTREKSIFCVPLYKTKQLDLLPTLEHQARHWQKYSAINCGTIFGADGGIPCFGTVEFRHLYGTSDVSTIVEWINNILCLRKAVVEYKLEDVLNFLKTANTTSAYLAMYNRIFGKYAMPAALNKLDFELCITRTKLAFWGNSPEFTKYRYRKVSSYGKLKNTPKEAKINKAQLDEMMVKWAAPVGAPVGVFQNNAAAQPQLGQAGHEEIFDFINN